MKKPCLSIVIATYNSGEKLKPVLESVRKQKNQKNILEILLIDGGSTDNTFSLAKKYHCRIVNNPRIEPVYAKFLGLVNATGKYVMYLDHDEVIKNENSINKKIALFSDKKVCAVLSTGYLNPPDYPFINDYINELGDPFSYFVYHFSKSKDNFIHELKYKYPIVSENSGGILFDFSKSNDLPLIELVAGGSIIDRQKLISNNPEVFKDFTLIPHLFYLFISEGFLIAMSKKDYLLHYSSDTFIKYLTKIKWRILNNIFFTDSMAQSGFLGREKYLSKRNKLKKYLFIPYSLTLILPLIDSILLAIKNKNIKYLMHIVLTLYTALTIIYLYILKICGYRPPLKSYDGSKKIK